MACITASGRRGWGLAGVRGPLLAVTLTCTRTSLGSTGESLSIRRKRGGAGGLWDVRVLSSTRWKM